MLTRASLRRTLSWVVFGLAATVGFAVLDRAVGADTTITTFGTKMTLMLVRAHKKGGEKMDPAIPRNTGDAIKNKFWKYKNFEKVSEETREAKLGRTEQFNLEGDKVIKITVIGYQPLNLLIKLKVQVGLDIEMMNLFSTESLYLQVGTGDDCLIAVITCTLLQQKN
jgi:hypothetical protein